MTTLLPQVSPPPPPESAASRLIAALAPSWTALGWPAPRTWRWTWDPARGWQIDLALVLCTAEPLDAVLDQIHAQMRQIPGQLQVVDLLRVHGETCCWIRVLDPLPTRENPGFQSGDESVCIRGHVLPCF
jgi:hypothetical protein